MSDNSTVLQLSPEDFSLSDYDNVRITLPEKPSISREDVDAQLFGFVLSTGRSVNSIDDLDDEWVKGNFEGLSTIEDVRQAIVDDYERNLELEYSDMKYRACCDALVERLQGEVDEAVVASNVESMRQTNQARLEAMHMSFEQYLRDESMTPDQYEEKLAQETLYLLRLNMALDLLAPVLGIQVGNHEITEYLSSPNPQKFLEEIREKGQVEAARQAAVRVKTMRRVIDTAYVLSLIHIFWPSSYRAVPFRTPSAAAYAPVPSHGYCRPVSRACRKARRARRRLGVVREPARQMQAAGSYCPRPHAQSRACPPWLVVPRGRSGRASSVRRVQLQRQQPDDHGRVRTDPLRSSLQEHPLQVLSGDSGERLRRFLGYHDGTAYRLSLYAL